MLRETRDLLQVDGEIGAGLVLRETGDLLQVDGKIGAGLVLRETGDLLQVDGETEAGLVLRGGQGVESVSVRLDKVNQAAEPVSRLVTIFAKGRKNRAEPSAG